MGLMDLVRVKGRGPGPPDGSTPTNPAWGAADAPAPTRPAPFRTEPARMCPGPPAGD